MVVKIKECPYCGHTEFVKGYSKGYARVLVQDNIFNSLIGKPVVHTICKKCNSIVYSKIIK